jgi:S1-C subfamily serine protease
MKPTKRILISALLLLTLAIPRPLAADVPLPIVLKSAASVEALRTDKGRIYCTAFSINEKQHLWMTARHCVVEQQPDGTYTWRLPHIGSEVATVYKEFPEMDVVIVQTEKVSAPALKLSDTDPGLYDSIFVIGHGWGWENNTIFEGHMANLSVTIPDWGSYMIFDMRAFPGHSGSPVMDKDGKVISVLQITVGQGATGGVRYFDLKTSTGQYFAQ